MPTENYTNYKALMQKLKDLESATAVLHWDMETQMPPKGAALRSQQLSTLQGLGHELFIADSTGELLEKLQEEKEGLSEVEQKNVALSWDDYQKAVKIPTDFIKEQSRLKSEAFQAWRKAREANDYSLFKEALSNIFASKREEAGYLDLGEHPYDSLLDSYERGMTVSKLDELFSNVRNELVDFVKEVREHGTSSPRHFLEHSFDKDNQWELGLHLLKNMGYSFEAGRQDISAHPFTISFSPDDVRVTTRIDEEDPLSMIGSCIHEGGHALYEQGLLTEQYGLPAGEATSLGIHESQSRLWENHVGRSFAYWKAHFDHLQGTFPAQLGGVNVRSFYKAINQVQPNLIRIEADELHYHLHVLIRFELEKGLIEGSISTDDLDERWNQLYKEYLNIEVPDAVQGVLQDVHWSQGLVGYFPTYSLGSFYAAQFFHQAMHDIPNLMIDIEHGKNENLLAWLRENIHQYGRQYTSEELCQRITGEGLQLKYFMQYARNKFEDIYGI